MAGKIQVTEADTKAFIEAFALKTSDILAVTNHCLDYLTTGLKENGGTQIPSFVTNIPNGSETGVYLAVDLGGTNCRVGAVNLHGNSKYSMKHTKHTVPREVMVHACHEPLFDFIASQISTFLDDNPDVDVSASLPSGGRVKLGFTFSFAYDSKSLSSGSMLHWDKGWDIPDAIGRDPCQMLQDAIDRLGLHVRVSALTNDSVGTLMARAYTSPQSRTPLIGAIFGTGTNAAYLEQISNVEKLIPTAQQQILQTHDVMVINTEWGAWFDNAAAILPTCIYDELLDRASTSPKAQLFEKRISAMYLGELARLAIITMASQGHFDMKISSAFLAKPYCLGTSFLSFLAVGLDKNKAGTAEYFLSQISASLGSDYVSISDAQKLTQLGEAIVGRAAQLAGAAIAAIIIHSSQQNSRDTFLTSSLQRVLLPLKSGLRTMRNLFCIPSNSTGDKDASTVDSGGVQVRLDKYVDIGIDGSLFEHHPHFEREMRSTMKMIPQIGKRGERRIKISLAKDGSSLGAALIAQSVQ